ncbi:MAG: UPF0182 family protein [Acidobacteriota bacterium]
MSTDSPGEIIDVGRIRPRRKRWRWFVLLAIVGLLFVGSRALSIYVSALWFGSLGYSSVYWYMFKLKIELFAIFAVLTILILRAGFWLVQRGFAGIALDRRTIIVNQQPVNFSPVRVLKPAGWVVAVIAGLVFGLSVRDDWRTFALYLHRVPTDLADPIFNEPIGFYLFTLPVYEAISAWLLYLAIIILAWALIYTVLAVTQQGLSTAGDVARARRTSVAVVSCAVAGWFLILAWRFLLSRYPYLWVDHQTFSGVTYTEANYLLPGYVWVAGALTLTAIIAVVNAFAFRRVRILVAGIAIPVLVYVVAGVIVPWYVTNFIVKPNELGRETPYIEHNIVWTRRAFGVDRIEQRNFEADNSVEAFDLQNNRVTLDNIRLWDWRALQDTLKQIQAIRTYYDFPDVDVDRYQMGGQGRQVMIAARELDESKLPDASRNWINERLIYTHGYGATMNTANGFTPEGQPRFILSNMPIESTAPEIKVTRPQIYFGQETNSDVYVKTKQKEFDFPQGESFISTSYDGTGGIQVGGGLRRLLLAWAVGDLAKLPFSDDVSADSRIMIHRNIKEIVNGIAPFLIYDSDPYIVAGNDGGLYWIIDAFTESANYPYSRHHKVGNNQVNYIRNSVKVVIDAYNGTTRFYIFDPQDPLIAAYRGIFPNLFLDAAQMPADLRSHVRYPETLLRVQGEVFSLYHTQNPKVLFQQEDVWSVAQQVSLNDQGQKQVGPIDPYFVLMQLPGEQAKTEFALILPFTPAKRNNMIGWMAGRCDGENYGKLLVYDFPKSRLIDGPLQIEARIDQNAQLSAQFSLWNQQGSRVVRGHMLVIPIGRSLLYVEPIYLRAESSPMPELRLVVLATQDRLGYGASFEEALNSLFGEAAKAPAESKGEQPAPQPGASPKPSPSPASSPGPAGTQNVQQLVNRAIQEFQEYQRLTSEGKLAEAGKKLEEHKRTLEELKRATGKP